MNIKELIHDNTIEDVFYLASCALNDTAPDRGRIANMDHESVFKVAARHSVESLLYYAFTLCDIDISLKAKATGEDVVIMSQALGISEDLLRKWQNSKKSAMLKNIQLDSERGKICAAMEEKGCWYLPLKGIVIKDMYPATGMRQMGDNDILFDASFRPWVREVFENNGYKTLHYDTTYDDVYFKQPNNLFEMHVSLVGPDNKKWWPYYEKVKDRLVKVDGSDYGYAFTDEDYYLYMMVHAFKHYDSAGTGVRIFFDTYVYLKNKQDTMDWEYIKGECEKLQITVFEENMRTLSVKIIDGLGVGKRDSKDDIKVDTKEASKELSGILNESEQKVLYYIMGSGTYGTNANRIKNGVERKSVGKDGKTVDASVSGKVSFGAKVRFLKSRIFLPKTVMYMNHPFARSHRWSLPFFYIKRIFKGIGQKRLYDEFGRVIKMKEEKH